MTSKRDIFLIRQQYGEKVKDLENLNLYDNWNTDDFKYLRFNRRNRAIIPENSEVFTHINKTNLSLDFVADAFAAFKQHYRDKVINGLQPYMDMQTLDVKRSYIPASLLYSEHLKNLERLFFDFYLSPDDIDNFEDYMEVMHKFLDENARRFPFTFSSFVASGLCPINVTGCFLELSEGGHNDDQRRMDALEHPSFDFFVRLANEYGFVVPTHAPWCLVANLDSSRMMSYAVQYDAEDRHIVEDQYFFECKDQDMQLLNDFIINTFDKFQREYFDLSKIHVCDSGKVIRKTIMREQIEAGLLFDSYPFRYWMKIYIQQKMRETNKTSKMTKKAFDTVFNRCYDVLLKYGFDQAFAYAEAKIFKIRKDRFR